LHRNGNKENSSLMTQLIDNVITNLLSNVVWADALQIDGQIWISQGVNSRRPLYVLQ